MQTTSRKRILESSSVESSMVDHRLPTPAALRQVSLQDADLFPAVMPVPIRRAPSAAKAPSPVDGIEDNAALGGMVEEEMQPELKRKYKDPVPRGTHVDAEIARLQQDQVWKLFWKEQKRLFSCLFNIQ